MLELKNEKCTGCEACTNICEYDAIQMHRNKEGFLYPIIDYEKCIKCNKCQSVCPLNKNIKGSSDSDIEVYAMKSKNKELRIHSTSGGAFSELAQIILNDGGSVAGAVYKQDWSVKHKLIGDINQLELLRRSKYQQSEIGLLYREIETKLNNNFKVLFCGAPCQAAGLKCYLNKDYDNLYICDFICRGVPSPGLFQAYLKYLKEIYGSEITSVWMKNKRNGWHSLTTVISFLDGNEYVKDGL
ncbi:MAG: 4Fe-4S binding protein, partial [Lachnospiraceae bacterium]|nr:4Fe-4S binding protein [Lachnospiraceae bacterium]